MKEGKKKEKEETPGTAPGHFLRTFAHLPQEGREEPKWQDLYGSSSLSSPHSHPSLWLWHGVLCPSPSPVTVGAGSLQFHCGLKVELTPSCGILAFSLEAFSFNTVQGQPP